MPGYEGKYEVSNLGRVKSLARFIQYRDGRHRPTPESILSPGNPKRYKTVALGVGNTKDIHRLVALVFCPGKTNKKNQVNHIDGNKHNNCATNLEWCTRHQNMRHAFSTGLVVAAKGVRNGSSKLTPKDVLHIRDEYYKPANNYGMIKKLSRGYGVSHMAIRDIIFYQTWTHV